jgi:nicotinamidase/pyrazinamidase
MSRKQKNVLVIVDMQNDFMDVVRAGIFSNGRTMGALPVVGATEDAKRITGFINRNGKSLDDISLTHDCHNLHIATPVMWIDKHGNHPNPFTNIFYNDAKSGLWRINSPQISHQERGIQYLKDLEDEGRYILTIWPPHCEIGTNGAAIQEDIMTACLNWQTKYVATLNHVTKGSNPWTEHYSAMKAAQVDSSDPSTAMNKGFINMLQKNDNIYFCGTALNFCVRETMLDVIREFDPDNVKKIILLTDCVSAIMDTPDTGTLFKSFTDSFMEEALNAGMRTAKSTDPIM